MNCLISYSWTKSLTPKLPVMGVFLPLIIYERFATFPAEVLLTTSLGRVSPLSHLVDFRKGRLEITGFERAELGWHGSTLLGLIFVRAVECFLSADYSNFAGSISLCIIRRPRCAEDHTLSLQLTQRGLHFWLGCTRPRAGCGRTRSLELAPEHLH